MPVKTQYGLWVLFISLSSGIQAEPAQPLPAAFWLYLDKYADDHGHVLDPKDFATLLTLPPPGVKLPPVNYPGSSASKEPHP